VGKDKGCEASPSPLKGNWMEKIDAKYKKSIWRLIKEHEEDKIFL
jgi:hypothetical protein